MEIFTELWVQVIAGLAVALIVAIVSAFHAPARQYITSNVTLVIGVSALLVLVLVLFSSIILITATNKNVAMTEMIATQVASDNQTTVSNAQADTPVVENLIQNGQFSEDVNNGDWEWNNYGNVVWAGGKEDRGACIVQRVENPIDSNVHFQQPFDVIPGEEYQFEGWLRWTDVRNLYVKIDWYTEDWKYLNTGLLTGPFTNSADSWVKQNGTVKAPLDARHAYFVVLQSINDEENPKANPIGSSFCVDEIILSRLP